MPPGCLARAAGPMVEGFLRQEEQVGARVGRTWGWMGRGRGGEDTEKFKICKLNVLLYAFLASVVKGQNQGSGRRDGGKWMV